jgi:hypothetical protein
VTEGLHAEPVQRAETAEDRTALLVAAMRRAYKWPSWLRVGYIATEGDEVLPVMEKMGARLVMLSPEGMETADLSDLHQIIVGPRAIEKCTDAQRAWEWLAAFAVLGRPVFYYPVDAQGRHILERLRPAN